MQPIGFPVGFSLEEGNDMPIEGFEDLDNLVANFDTELAPIKRIMAAAVEMFLRQSDILPNDEYRETAIAILKGRAMGKPDMAAIKSLDGVAERIGEARNQKWRDAWQLWFEVENSAMAAMAEKIFDPRYTEKVLTYGEAVAAFKSNDAVSIAGFIVTELAAAYLKLSPSFNAPPVAMPVSRGPLSQGNSEPRSMNINTEAKVREAHRLLKAGTKWAVVKRTCAYGTYIRWCYVITGEKPVTKL
jgi:hypothetical protein